MCEENQRKVLRERVLSLHRQGIKTHSQEIFSKDSPIKSNSLSHFLFLWLYIQSFIRLYAIYPQVQLSLGDFVAARRSLKKALLLGSQQLLDRQAVKKAFKYGKIFKYFYCPLNLDNLYVVIFVYIICLFHSGQGL